MAKNVFSYINAKEYYAKEKCREALFVPVWARNEKRKKIDSQRNGITRKFENKGIDAMISEFHAFHSRLMETFRRHRI